MKMRDSVIVIINPDLDGTYISNGRHGYMLSTEAKDSLTLTY